MKPVDMIVRHDPPASIGDCFRCCIASILELPAEAVPHFMADDWGKTKDFTWFQRLNQWLKARGLTYLELNVAPDQHSAGWFQNVEPAGFATYHVLSGSSRRAEHSVVARNGVMMHDPAPQKDGLIGPNHDSLYVYGLLVPRHGA